MGGAQVRGARSRGRSHTWALTRLLEQASVSGPPANPNANILGQGPVRQGSRFGGLRSLPRSPAVPACVGDPPAVASSGTSRGAAPAGPGLESPSRASASGSRLGAAGSRASCHGSAALPAARRHRPCASSLGLLHGHGPIRFGPRKACGHGRPVRSSSVKMSRRLGRCTADPAAGIAGCFPVACDWEAHRQNRSRGRWSRMQSACVRQLVGTRRSATRTPRLSEK